MDVFTNEDLAGHIRGTVLYNSPFKFGGFVLRLRPQIDGRCAISWEPATNIVYFEKNADLPCWTGSTAKAMTVHATLWAEHQGHVALTDTISYTQKAVEQGCTCIGNYDLNMGSWASWVEPIDIANIGEQSTLDEALYGVAMSAAQPTVTVAEYVAAAALLNTKTPAQSVTESTNREVMFAQQIMNVQAATAGATNTVFMNEHGGWLPVKDGVWQGPPKSSARDFVKMWQYFTQFDPRFLDYLGLRYFEHTTLTPTTSTTPAYVHKFGFFKRYGYYPKIEGDKNGGVHPQPDDRPYSSLISGSTRLARRVLVDVMETEIVKGSEMSAARDSGILYAHAFSQIFTPRSFGSADAGAKVFDIGLDCAAPDKCVSVEIGAGGLLRFRTWGVQFPIGGITELWATPARRAVAPGAPLVYREIDMAYLGDINPQVIVPQRTFVTAARRNDGTDTVELTTWRLDNNNQISKLADDGGTAGTGVTLRVIPLPTPAGSPRLAAPVLVSGARFLLAAREKNGRVTYSVWSVNAQGAMQKLSELADELVLEYDVAPSFFSRFAGFVAAHRKVGSLKVVLRGYEVQANGAIALIRLSAPQNNQSYISLTALDVQGGSPRYALAGSSFADPGTLTVTQFGLTPNAIERLGIMGPFEAAITDTAVAPIAPGGIVVAARDDNRLSVAPMEYDQRFKDDSNNEEYFKLGEATGERALWIHLRVLTTTPGRGAYVTAYRTQAETLKLTGWTIGY